MDENATAWREGVREGGLFLLAGEASGDLLGARLIRRLRECGCEEKVWGVAGPKMRAEGVETLLEMERLQIMGFTGVIRALPMLFKQIRHLRNAILKAHPAVVVLIDYPGFNMRLTRDLRKAGYQGKIVQYVCPTVWAWRSSRIPQLAQSVDLLLTLFPFEPQYFAHTPLWTEFVGHPAVEAIGASPVSEKPDEHLVALFPGSRGAEIALNLEIQIKAAKKLRESHPELRFAISVARPDLEPAIRNTLWRTQFEAELHQGESPYPLMRCCRLALATSGTVTLELALHEVPTVVVYRPSLTNALLARLLFRIQLSRFCIVNILCKRFVFPERVHWIISSEDVAKQAAMLLDDSEERRLCLEGCREVRERLSHECDSLRAAHLIQQIAQSSASRETVNRMEWAKEL